MARWGDRTAMKLCMDRLFPRRRSAPVEALRPDACEISIAFANESELASQLVEDDDYDEPEDDQSMRCGASVVSFRRVTVPASGIALTISSSVEPPSAPLPNR